MYIFFNIIYYYNNIYYKCCSNNADWQCGRVGAESSNLEPSVTIPGTSTGFMQVPCQLLPQALGKRKTSNSTEPYYYKYSATGSTRTCINNK